MKPYNPSWLACSDLLHVAGRCMVWSRVNFDGYDAGLVATAVTDVPACQEYCKSNNSPFFTLKPYGCYCKTSDAGA